MAIYQGHNEDSSGNLLLSIGNGMTATVETGSTASQAYTKGSYLFFNNRLCKAASAIASGATLTIGGNLTQTSLGAEITSHLRSSDGKEFYFDVKNGQYGYYPSASKTASEFVPFGGTSFVEPSQAFILVNNGYQSSKISISKGTNFTTYPCFFIANIKNMSVTKLTCVTSTGYFKNIVLLDDSFNTLYGTRFNWSSGSEFDFSSYNPIYVLITMNSFTSSSGVGGTETYKFS